MPESARVARFQRARERAAFGARVGLDLLLIALGAAGAWLLGIWAAGTLLVHVQAPAAEPVVVRQALQPQPAGDAYAFDELPRELDGALACPRVGLIDYAGTSVRLAPPVRIATPFREHVIRLEEAARETALRVYGRAPSALSIAASYDCRPVTRNRARLSEHALGNAIDVSAVRFDADPARQEPAFEVRVDRHWNAGGDARTERHARFLRALAEELLRRDVFRTLLGPAHPDHDDHFHFDMAPHRYVAL